MKELKNLERVSDPITRERILTLHPLVRQDVVDGIVEVEQTGLRIRIVQALRSMAEQKRIYDQGRTAPGEIVTWAKPGLSFHNYGLAFDFCLLHGDKKISWDREEDLDQNQRADWDDVVFVFKAKGWAWGGDFPVKKKDFPHLQKTLGLSIALLYSKHESGLYGPDRFLLLA